jgi:iron-sulfur cluster assembly accessory protein
MDSAPSDAPSVNASTASAPLAITPGCVRQIHALLKRKKKSPDEMFLRVFVDAGGCSGFTYKFEMDDELIEEEDIVFQPPDGNGARVVVDEASLKLIQGSKIDYVQEMIKSAFVVADNPQSESACGCGSSFAVKNFAVNPALD